MALSVKEFELPGRKRGSQARFSVPPTPTV